MFPATHEESEGGRPGGIRKLEELPGVTPTIVGYQIQKLVLVLLIGFPSKGTSNVLASANGAMLQQGVHVQIEKGRKR